LLKIARGEDDLVTPGSHSRQLLSCRRVGTAPAIRCSASPERRGEGLPPEAPRETRGRQRRPRGGPVSVTDCPLTGTVQGFKRGETTVGISGRINNNLVMATAQRRPSTPDTRVLSTETGVAETPAGTPYGSYNPWIGYFPGQNVYE